MDEIDNIERDLKDKYGESDQELRMISKEIQQLETEQ